MDRPLKRRSAAPLLLCAVLGACSLPLTAGEASGPGATDAPPCVDTRGQLVLERINALRVEHGLRTLVAEERLIEAALAHSADQAAGGPDAVGHLGSDGSAPGERVTRAGYGWSLVAENVAAGQAWPDAVVYAWMNSPPHMATILSPGAVHAGVGYVRGPDGGLSHYWTLVVAEPRHAAEGQPVPCHP